MAKYHINSKGEPSVCKATKKCPFGESSDHYSTKTEARKAYEATQVTHSTVTSDPWAGEPGSELDQLADEQVRLLQEKFESQEVLTDEEYESRRDYIRQTNRAYPSTHKHFTKKIAGKIQYPPERDAQHEEITEEILSQFENIPKNGEVILTGGMPGSGKTTILNREFPDIASTHAVLNPDDIKVLMAEKGMTPQIKGLTPMETDELIMYEAQIIYKRIYERATEDRMNIAIDKTMIRKEPVIKDIDQLKAKGYTKFDTVFAHIEPDTAYDRIVNRHRQGINEHIATGGKTLGERVVPGSAIAAARTEEDSEYDSKNAETLAELTRLGVFTSPPKIYDTSTRESARLTIEELTSKRESTPVDTA